MTVAWSPPALLESRGYIEIWNALQSLGETVFPLSAKGVSAIAATAPAPQSAHLAALIEADGTRAVLIFDSFPFAELFDADLETADLENLPMALRDVLVHGMASMLRELAPKSAVSTFSIIEISDWTPDQASRPLNWLSVRLQGLAKSEIRIRIGCDADGLTRILTDKNLAPRAVWERLRERLTVEASTLIGWMSAPLARVRQLREGDVIAMPEGAENVLWIRIGADLHRLEENEDGWIYADVIVSRPSHQCPIFERTEIVTNEAEAPEEQGTALAHLTLDLDFEIARAQMPISVVETWRPGTMVDLPEVDLSGALEVTIRANGQKIAKGDLLRIDDRLAILLTKLLAD